MIEARRFGMPFDKWPTDLRQRGTTLKIDHRRTLGRLLSYCKRSATTICEDAVRSYLEWYRNRSAEVTANKESNYLRCILPTMFPEGEWGWLFSLTALHQPMKRTRGRRSGAPGVTRLSVPPCEWPKALRAVLEPVGTGETGAGRFQAILQREAPKLSKPMQTLMGCAYGQYLHHRRSRGEDDAITCDGVASFAEALEDRGLRPRSIATYVETLAILAKTAKLPGDWTWLDADAADLGRRAREYSKLKHSRNLPHPLDIWRLGQSLVETTRSDGCRTPTAAVAHRDGLLLMLAISNPLRLSNLAGIKIGSTLVIEGDLSSRSKCNTRYNGCCDGTTIQSAQPG